MVSGDLSKIRMKRGTSQSGVARSASQNPAKSACVFAQTCLIPARTASALPTLDGRYIAWNAGWRLTKWARISAVESVDPSSTKQNDIHGHFSTASTNAV